MEDLAKQFFIEKKKEKKHHNNTLYIARFAQNKKKMRIKFI